MTEISSQILTCPLCQAQQKSDDAKEVPEVRGINGGVAVPKRYMTYCPNCRIPFYTAIDNGQNGN